MNKILFFLLLLLPVQLFSQEDPLFVKTDSMFLSIPHIDVENGTTILVQCKILDDKTLKLERVPGGQTPDSSRTLIISYHGTTLSVINPFDLALGYEAYLYSPSMKKYYLRKTYPVRPKMGSKEIYPDAAKFFRLSNFHLAEYETIQQEKQYQQELMIQHKKSQKKKKRKKN